MLIDLPSAAAFSPLPAIIEPAGRRGGASPNPRHRPTYDRSSSVDGAITPPSLSQSAQACIETEARLRVLRIEAHSENLPFSDASLADFRAFQRENSPWKRPAIFLTNAGNIRAVWTSGDEQIGLQFFGNREVQFVIFAARPRSTSMNRLAGNIGLDSVMGFARTAGVERLFSA